MQETVEEAVAQLEEDVARDQSFGKGAKSYGGIEKPKRGRPKKQK